jgi:hypothetical protein
MPDRDVTLKVRAAYEQAQALSRAGKDLKQLAEETTQAQRQLRTLERQAGQVGAFQKLLGSFRETGRELKTARAEAARLGAAYGRAEKPTAALRRQVEQAQKRVARLTATFEKQRSRLAATRNSLREAGVSTSRLGQVQAGLRARIGAATAAVQRQNEVLRTAARRQAELRRVAARAGEGLQRAANISFIGFAVQQVGRTLLRPFRDVIDATVRQEQAERQLEQRLRSTGSAAGLSAAELKTMSAELQGLTTFGDEAVLELEGLLLTFTKIRGPVFREATETVLDMSVALGQDLKSSAIQLGKALNDPVAGITALRRVGVSFTAAQQAQIKALAESGDLMSAQRLILAELSTEFGGAARAAADTFGGSLEQLKNAAGDLFEAEGGLPQAREAIKALTQALASPGTKAAIDSIASQFVGLAVAAAKSIKAIVELAAEHQTFAKVLGTAAVFLGGAATAAAPLILAYAAVRAMAAGVNRVVQTTRIALQAAAASMGGTASAATGLSGTLGTTTAALGRFVRAAGALRLVGFAAVVGELIRLAQAMNEAKQTEQALAQSRDAFVAKQHQIIETTRAEAAVRLRSREELESLTADELAQYTRRLAAARDFYGAQARLQARLDAERLGPTAQVTEEALAAAAAARIRREALREAERVLSARTDAEADFAARIADIKAEETETLKAQLAEQVAAYEKANNAVQAAQEQRLALEEEFEQALGALGAPKGREEPPGVLDIAQSLAKARQALAASDFEGAISGARAAKEAILAANQAGTESELVLRGLLGQAKGLALEAAEGQETRAETEAQTAKTAIESLVGQAEFLKHIKVGFDAETAEADAETLCAEIERRLAQNPIVVPVVLGKPEGKSDANAAALPENLPTRAAGGLMRGPGTATSDSILALLSRGEYVLRAEAVRRYGVPLLESMNRLRFDLPRFAEGGLAPPRVPSVPSFPAPLAGAGGTPVHLHLDGREFGPLTGPTDVVGELKRAVANNAAKHGRRR